MKIKFPAKFITVPLQKGLPSLRKKGLDTIVGRLLKI